MEVVFGPNQIFMFSVPFVFLLVKEHTTVLWPKYSFVFLYCILFRFISVLFVLCFKYENEFENDGLEIGQLCHPREMYRTVSVFNYFPKKKTVYFYLRVKKK